MQVFHEDNAVMEASRQEKRGCKYFVGSVALLLPPTQRWCLPALSTAPLFALRQRRFRLYLGYAVSDTHSDVGFLGLGTTTAPLVVSGVEVFGSLHIAEMLAGLNA